MANKKISSCPVCGGSLIIKEVSCTDCGTTIKGEFEEDKFSKLSQEEKNFIEIFVMKRGSIKEIEKELGISYPTVRNKLDGVIKSLGHDVGKEESRIDILNRLNEGEISPEEATELLKEYK